MNSLPPPPQWAHKDFNLDNLESGTRQEPEDSPHPPNPLYLGSSQAEVWRDQAGIRRFLRVNCVTL